MACSVVDFRTDAAKHGAYLLLFLDVFEERRRVRAVSAPAILGCPSRLRGIGDNHANLGQAMLHSRRPCQSDRALQLVGQRVVAAGIQHKNAQVLGLLKVRDDVVHPCHTAQVRLVGELGVDRHQTRR